MPWSSPTGKIVGRIGPTVGGGTGGWLAIIATAPRTSTVIAVAAVLVMAMIGNCLPKIFESIFKRRAQIIKVKGEARAAQITATSNAETALIQATSEAEALRLRTQTRTALLRLGADPFRAEQAAEMLRLQALDADLPEGHRMSDEALAKLLAASKIRDAGNGPGRDPGGVVRPLRQPPPDKCL
jgi:hypothetical protein